MNTKTPHWELANTGAVRQKSIAWTNFDQVLGHSELTHLSLALEFGDLANGNFKSILTNENALIVAEFLVEILLLWLIGDRSALL